MNSVARYQPVKDSNPPCPDLMTMAETGLSAFFKTVTHLFGSELAQLSAEDWLHERIEIDDLPRSAREWRLITAKAFHSARKSSEHLVPLVVSFD